MNYQYLLFDLDGTLTDPGIGITNSVMYALRKFGIEVADRAELYPFIGPPLKDSFMKYFNFTLDDALLAVDYYREYFGDKGLFENTPYDGIHELLAAVKGQGHTLLICTSKPEVFVHRILEQFQLVEFFDFIAGATIDGTRLHKEEVIRHALELAAIPDVSQCLMIGDRHFDIDGAHQHGLDACGVTYGYGSRAELEAARAEYIVDSVPELRKLLYELTTS